MATSIPASLKSADIARFATRAAQIERVKPVIAYWCNFWIVNQIIERGLHTTDEEVKQYTTDLVDKLERFKSENPDNDTLLDSDAASAYVEEFGLEVFNRAETTMKANKVTRQTADTFQAAATFLELCQVWGALDPEVAAKVKFAKYHAVRIMKAIKAGEDPNATNPAPKAEEEESPEAELGQVDPTVDESMAQQVTQPRQPFVEDVTDDSSRPSSALPQPPTGAPSKQDAPLDLPSAPATFATTPSIPNLPDTPASTNLGVRPSSSDPFEAFQSFPPPSSISPPSPTVPSHDASSFYGKPSPPMGVATPPEMPLGTVPGRPYQIPQPAPAPAPVPVPAQPAPAAATGHLSSQTIDDNSIALAQKHARWAVSALAFDDVNTAIKELRNSLRYLGAE